RHPAVRRLARLRMDAYRLGADTRPELRAALGLERRRRARLRRRERVPRTPRRGREVRLPRRSGRYGPRRMALRHGRGAELRRSASRRAGFVALAVALYLAAGVAATWPAVQHARSHFLSGGAPGHGDASPGDHLQTLWHYWLVGHQLEHGHAPWRDPYTFQPEAKPQPNYAGWPFGFLFWPLGTLFGLVVGWNVLQLVIYLLARLLTYAWLRALGLPRGPALAGGLVFAIAPYRVQQSVGHLLGPISIMLPLSLWAFERGWLWLSALALASIPLSGQVHLALGAIPFVV